MFQRVLTFFVAGTLAAAVFGEWAAAQQLEQRLRSPITRPRSTADSPAPDPRISVPQSRGALDIRGQRDARSPAAHNPPSRRSRASAAHDPAALLADLGARAPYDVSPDGRWIVAVERDGGGLAVWNAGSRTRERRLANSQLRYAQVAISDDGRWIAALREEAPGEVDLWRGDTGRRLDVAMPPGVSAVRLRFSESGKELLIWGDDGGGVALAVPSGREVRRIASGRSASPPRAAFAPQPDRSDDHAPRETARDVPSGARRARARPPTGVGPAAPAELPSAASPAPAGIAPRSRFPEAAEPSTARESEPAAGRPVPRMADPAAPREPAPSEPASAAPIAPEPPPAPSPHLGEFSEPRMAAPAARDGDPPGEGPDLRAAPRMAAPPIAPPGAEEAPPPALAAPDREFEDGPPDTSADGAAIDVPQPGAAAPAEGDGGVTPAVEPSAAAADPGGEAPSASPPPDAADVASPDFASVRIHYATNRNRLSSADREWMVYFRGFFASLPAVIIYALVLVALLILPWIGKRSWALPTLVGGAVICASMAALEAHVRSQLRNELSGENYGSRPTELSYGVCEVSVPRPENRRPGELSRPVSAWIFEAPEDAEKHFVLRRIEEQPDKTKFLQSLSAQLKKTAGGDALLFIHGYNVSFEDAIFRTAQLTVDLGFNGCPITFSWPSFADPVKYTFDEQNAEVSIPALREFLEDLAARSGAKRVYIIAHSMGNRVLAGALENLDSGAVAAHGGVFQEVILAAPDIDSRVFRSQVLPHIVRVARHCTLYASSRDRALRISRLFHNYQRLGESDPDLLVAQGLDTIDASSVDTSLLGHSYIGDVQSIVSDLHNLVVRGKRPPERVGLQSARRGELLYWSIQR